MSTILDALRKSKEAPPKDPAAAEPRREILSLGSHDYLATVGASAGEDRVRLLRWLLVGVGAVALLLAGILVAVLARSGANGHARPPVQARETPTAIEPTPAATTAATTAAAPSAAAVAPVASPPAAEVRVVVVSVTPEPAVPPAPAALAPAATAASTPTGTALPPPLTVAGPEEMPQPVPPSTGAETPPPPMRLPAVAAHDDPSAILATLRLEGIVYDKRDPVAMINGRMVRPGAVMGSVRVVRIQKDTVTVRIGDNEYSLAQ